jgi:hypothetical protein
MEQQTTRIERIIARVKGYPVVAVVILFGTIVIAASTFTDAAKNLIGLVTSSPETARIKLSRIPLEYTPASFIFYREREKRQSLRRRSLYSGGSRPRRDGR